MPSKHDRAQIDRSGGDRARCPHSVPRASPRLEILETRCLMSDLSGLEASSPTAPYPDAVPVRLRHAAIEYSLPTLPLPLGVPKPAPTANETKVAPVEEAEYRPATPGSAGTALALEDPAHAAYVIVHETAAPHSTLASAQDLPNLPYFGVIGTLGSDNPIDFYQMTIGAAAAGIQFELVAQQPAASTPVQLSLYDASGRVLGTWTSGARPQPDGSPLSLDLPSQSPGSTLYIGISAPSSSGDGPAGSATTTDYQLWVARLTAPDRSADHRHRRWGSRRAKRILDAHPGPLPTLDHSSSGPAGSSSRSDFDHGHSRNRSRTGAGRRIVADAGGRSSGRRDGQRRHDPAGRPPAQRDGESGGERSVFAAV